jgi:hypothetical protein
MPSPSLHRFSLVLLAGLALAGCAAEQSSSLGTRNSAMPPPAGAGGASNAQASSRPYAAPPASERRLIPETPIGDGRGQTQASLAAACTQQADRVLVQRDRSEIMREDERDSRQGTFDSPFQFRAPLDQMGRRYERDQIARDCVLRNTRGTPDR